MNRLGRLLARVPEPVWAVALFVVTISIAMMWRWIVAPVTTDADAMESADAVVLFVGGRGERLEAALDLMERDVAEVLVIPNGFGPAWPDADEVCREGVEFEVICPVPDPNTTRGEARTIGALADERGWDSVVMVTSTYHVERARLMLGRCFDGEITAVDATPDLTVWDWVTRINHEWFGHLHARVIARGC